jgi:hypothetical protein
MDAARERLGRAAAMAVAATWVATASIVLTGYFRVTEYPHELRIAQWLRTEATAADVIVFPGYSRAVPEYYLTRWDTPGERRSFPAETAAHLGWFDAEAAVRALPALNAEAVALARELAHVPSRGGRVLVVDRGAGGPAVEVHRLLLARLGETMGEPVPGWRPHESRPPSVWVFGAGG